LFIDFPCLGVCVGCFFLLRIIPKQRKSINT
jgi:hypothetical protein